MEYTTNYHLPPWVETDRIMMEDFNDAMASIDEGMSSNAQAAAEKPYVVGTYTGDGTTNNRTITLGFQPKFVIISGSSRSTTSASEQSLRFAMVGFTGTSNTMVGLIDTGFIVKNNSFQYPQLNVNGTLYAYIAFK